MAATIQLIIEPVDKVSATLEKIQKAAEKPIQIKIETGKIDQVTKEVVKYVNAQAKLETATAKLAAVQARLQIEQEKTRQTATRLATAQQQVTISASRLAAEGERTTQSYNRMAIEQDRVTQSANRLSIEEERTAQSMNRLAIEQEKTARATKQYSEEARSAATHTNILSNAFKSLAGILLSKVRQSFSDALSEMKRVDTELVTIQKVTGESAQGMKRFADDAYAVASRLGASASEYLNAVAEFSKAGFRGETAKQLGELAITTKVVGDTTIETANQFLLAVNAAYQYEGSIDKLTAVLDGANEIGNNFATSVDKIAAGLGKISPIAAQAHVGIDELSAALGTITAVTQRSGAEAATALRALFLNIIGDTKTEIEDGAKWTAGEIEGLRDVLRKFAPDVVKAAEATHSLIDPMEAIGALADAMSSGFLNEQKLMAMVSDIGGKLRTSQLLALIQNFKMYQDQLQTYREAAGSAAKEYAIYLDSWEAKTKQLSATWTDFVQRRIGSRQIKDLLDNLIMIVDNLESFVPAIVAIGVAIAALNLNKVIDQVKDLKKSLNDLTNSAFGPLGIAITIASLAVGAWNTALKVASDRARKQAEESEEAATKAREEADAMMELAVQLGAAKEGSSEYIAVSASMQQALKDEGIEVKNLSEDYRELTRSKLEAAQEAARKEYTDTGIAFASAYKSANNSFSFNSPVRVRGFNLNNELDRQVFDIFAGSNAAAFNVDTRSNRSYFSASNGKTLEGITSYYQLVVDALDLMDEAVYARFESGDDAGAEAIRKSTLYKELMDVKDAIGTEGDKYLSAREKYRNAQTALEGFGLFNDLIDWMKQGPDQITIDQYSNFLATLEKSGELTATQKNYLKDLGQEIFPKYTAQLGAGNGKLSDYLKLMGELEDQSITSLDAYIAWMDALKTNNNLTDEQKTILEEMAKHTYKDFASAVLEAKSALSQFNEAMEGGDKDDRFKSYKNVYDEVMKAAKRGAYGSNAFQYGIQALLDPETIKTYKGNWSGLVKFMQGSLGDLYKDSDSMGRGLLDRITKVGDKVKGSLYEIKEGSELLASYDKKTGEWYISDKPEDIKKLAGKLNMSAESLVAAGIALGAMDPNADVEGLSKALESILGGGEEKLTAEQLAAEAIKAAAESDQQSAQTFSESVNAFASLVEGLKSAFGVSGDGSKGNGTGATGGTGGGPAGPTETETDLMDKHDGVYVKPDKDSVAIVSGLSGLSTRSKIKPRGKGDMLQTMLDGLLGSNTPITETWGDIDQSVGGSHGDTSASKGWFIDALFGKGTFNKIAGAFGLSSGGNTEPIPVEVVDESGSGSGGGQGRGKRDKNQTWLDNHLPTNAVTNAEEQGLVVHPGAGALNSANDRFTAWMYERYGVKPIVTGSGATAYRPGGTPNHHRVAPEDTFSGSGQWVSPPEPITVTGAVAEGVKEGIELVSGSGSKNIFSGTGAFVSPSEIPNAVAEGVEQGIEASSNKDTAAYHNGYRGGIPFGDFNASQFGMAHPTGGGSLILDVLGGLFGGVAAGSVAEVAIDNSQAQESIEETKSALEEIDNTEAEAEASLDPSGAEEGAAAAKAAIESIPTLVASSVLINVDINTTRHGLGAGGNSGGDWVKETRATGDESFHGGPVLVNDEVGGWNPELIVANGRAFIANGGDPTIVNLPRGSVIYNADETRDILNGGIDLFNIPSFASGKESKPYSGNNKKKKSSGDDGGSSGSSSSGSSSKKFDDDMMKKLEQYMADILDAAEDALNDQLEAINAQIYALKYQTEAAEKATALEEARLQLLEAEKNLLDANTERTVRYYNAATGQWEWMADQREVNRAQEELYDAQKNLLEAEYDALATAWKELKDEISKALENNEEIDINAILTALGKSAASGSLPALKTLIGDIGTYTDDPRAVANFDGGGLARGLGWMPKGTAGTEAVLDSALTSAILHPQMNQAFSSFTDSLTTLFNLAGGTSLPSSRYGGNVSNMYGGNTYIEGVKIGSDMLNRPLSEVLSTLNLYVHN